MSADLIELIKVLQLRAEQCDRGNWYVSLSEMHTILDALAAKDAALSEMRAELERVKLALHSLCDADAAYCGNTIQILCDSHSEAIQRMRLARAALASQDEGDAS